jgi:hypothetical protein
MFVVRRMPDVQSSANEVMTDGNAPAGAAIMAAVTHMLRSSDSGVDFGSTGAAAAGAAAAAAAAAAVQGRLGEFKGVWVYNPCAQSNELWVRPSMEKYEVQDRERTSEQSQLEVRVPLA